MPQDDGQEPGPQAGGWVPPPQHFAPPQRTPESPPPTAAGAPVPHGIFALGRLRTVLVGTAVVAVLLAAGLAATAGGQERPGPVFVGLPPAPVVPVFPDETPPAPAPSRPTPPPTSQVREVKPQADPTRTRARARTPPASSAPAVVLPVVGQELGLAPVGEPGRRLRHRDFVARIDPVGPASPALDRADSRFTARTGRAGTGCLSFESFNYPGFFLRAGTSALRLERPYGRGFDADATFCAVPAPAGGFVLRSQRYPARYVTESNDMLSLNPVASARAKAFVTRPPL